MKNVDELPNNIHKPLYRDMHALAHAGAPDEGANILRTVALFWSCLSGVPAREVTVAGSDKPLFEMAREIDGRDGYGDPPEVP